jgi:hypothetical protein
VLSFGSSLSAMQDGASAREIAGAGVGAAGIGAGVAGLVMETTPALVSRGVPLLGFALSAWDTADAVKKGDTLGAIGAAAPIALAGGFAAYGAATGSFAPGVGTAIGAVAGAAIGLGIGFGRRILGDHPDEKLEKSTQSFLQGALEARGLSADEARTASHQLRDVDGEFFGVGPHIARLAERAGVPPGELLTRVVRLPEARLHAFVKDSLAADDNGDDVRDAEAARADGDKKRAVPTFRVDADDLDALWARWAAELR